jgi:phosphatidylglycerol:prolipoprotein diacylglycerol transferase
MDRVAFNLFGRWPVYWYGVCFALAFVAAVIHWNALARRQKRPPGFGSEVGFWLMLSGLVGARLAYILANLDVYLADPREILYIRHGGLVFYGGAIGAAFGLMVFARARRDSVPGLLDFAVSGLPLGHAIGRVGCFLNGCCYGTPTSLPWGVHVEGACRHPTPLYETAANLAVYAALLRLGSRKQRDGQVLAAYLVLYPVGRFLIEFLRGDQRLHWIGLNVAQETSLVLFALGIALWLKLRRSGRNPDA